jgi:hypothetical protein
VIQSVSFLPDVCWSGRMRIAPHSPSCITSAGCSVAGPAAPVHNNNVSTHPSSFVSSYFSSHPHPLIPLPVSLTAVFHHRCSPALRVNSGRLLRDADCVFVAHVVVCACVYKQLYFMEADVMSRIRWLSRVHDDTSSLFKITSFCEEAYQSERWKIIFRQFSLLVPHSIQSTRNGLKVKKSFK